MSKVVVVFKILGARVNFVPGEFLFDLRVFIGNFIVGLVETFRCGFLTEGSLGSGCFIFMLGIGLRCLFMDLLSFFRLLDCLKYFIILNRLLGFWRV